MNRRTYLSGLAGITASVIPRTTRAQTQRVRIGSGSNDTYALSYFAKDGGFFERAGIEADVQLFNNAQEMQQAMAGDALDVAVGDPLQIGNAFNNGLRLGFIAPATIYSSRQPTTFLCVAKDGPIRSANSLENGTVAVVALSSLMTVGLLDWLTVNGADSAKIKMVELPFPAMAAAVTRGTVAAAILAEPFLSAAAQDVHILGDPLAPVASTYLLSGIITKRDWVSTNTDLTSRLRKAYSATSAWANSHHDETARILATYSKINVETVRTMRRATLGTTLDPRLLQPVLDVAFKYGQLQKPTHAADLVLSVS